MRSIVSGYIGPHRVVLRRNSENLGIARHFNIVFSLVAGDFVVVAAGDDVSMPNRTEKLVDLWCEVGRGCVSIFSAMDDIDAAGMITLGKHKSSRNWGRVGPRDMLVRNIGVQGASHACSRKLLCDFPAMIDRVVNEDHVIPFRASMMDGVFYHPECLVKYRSEMGIASNYGNNKSRRSKVSPVFLLRPYLVTMQKCIDIIDRGRIDLLPLAKSRRADYLLRYRISRGRNWTLRKLLFFARRASFLFFCRTVLGFIVARVG